MNDTFISKIRVRSHFKCSRGRWWQLKLLDNMGSQVLLYNVMALEDGSKIGQFLHYYDIGLTYNDYAYYVNGSW